MLSLQHNWDVTPAQARAIQERLRPEVITQDDLGSVTLVAGVDVGFEASGSVTRAAVAVLTLADLQLVESAVHYTLRCTPKYRLPETTRQAHRLASGLP